MPPRKGGEFVSVGFVLEDSQFDGLAVLGVKVLISLFPVLQHFFLGHFLLLVELLFLHQSQFFRVLLELSLDLIVSDFFVVGNLRDHVEDLLGDPLIDDFEGFAVLKGLPGHIDIEIVRIHHSHHVG